MGFVRHSSPTPQRLNAPEAHSLGADKETLRITNVPEALREAFAQWLVVPTVRPADLELQAHRKCEVVGVVPAGVAAVSSEREETLVDRLVQNIEDVLAHFTIHCTVVLSALVQGQPEITNQPSSDVR